MQRDNLRVWGMIDEMKRNYFDRCEYEVEFYAQQSLIVKHHQSNTIFTKWKLSFALIKKICTLFFKSAPLTLRSNYPSLPSNNGFFLNIFRAINYLKSHDLPDMNAANSFFIFFSMAVFSSSNSQETHCVKWTPEIFAVKFKRSVNNNRGVNQQQI